MYGIDNQRRKSEYKINNIPQETRYYLGNYEEKTDHTTGITQKIHYLRGGAILIISPPSGEPEGALYYGYYDYLGSLVALVNAKSNEVERYAYDPWGVRRNPSDWSQKDNRTSWIVNRGFTGHEHLDAFGIINMNGRVYDPLMAQFFSPDPRLQAPGDWWNYNRYAYAHNNPFKYTDPDGEYAWLIISAAFAIGRAIMDGVKYENASYGNNFWTGFGKSFAISAASSLLTYGVGSMFGHALGDFGAELARAGMHGLVGGGLNAVQGGSFKQGFGVGFVSSLAGSGMMAAGMSPGLLPFATGTVGAGTAWALGGNLISGFSQGYSIGALNHTVPDDPTHMHGKDIEEVTVTAYIPRLSFVGTFQGVNVYESLRLGSYYKRGEFYYGVTLPPAGIFVGIGVFKNDLDMMMHEFGHILQYRKHGAYSYYTVFAPKSFASASINPQGHNNYWVETYANYLSYNYFYSKETFEFGWKDFYWNHNQNPVQKPNWWDIFK